MSASPLLLLVTVDGGCARADVTAEGRARAGPSVASETAARSEEVEVEPVAGPVDEGAAAACAGGRQQQKKKRENKQAKRTRVNVATGTIRCKKFHCISPVS